MHRVRHLPVANGESTPTGERIRQHWCEAWCRRLDHRTRAGAAAARRHSAASTRDHDLLRLERSLEGARADRSADHEGTTTAGAGRPPAPRARMAEAWRRDGGAAEAGTESRAAAALH